MWVNCWSFQVSYFNVVPPHLAAHTLDATVKALNHGNSEMLFRHYRAVVKPSEWKKLFTIFPVGHEKASPQWVG